jgi:hypothetical protein
MFTGRRSGLWRMPAFRLDGRKAVVVKRICFLFVQRNVFKNDAAIQQEVKITIGAGEEGVAGIIPAVSVFLGLPVLFGTDLLFTTATHGFRLLCSQ